MLALVATIDAAYLTWTSFTHGVVAGCDGTGHGGCDEVLTSRWSRAAGLPVALGGLLCYGTILVLALMAGTRAFNESRALATVLATAALLAALSGIVVYAAASFRARRVLLLLFGNSFVRPGDGGAGALVGDCEIVRRSLGRHRARFATHGRDSRCAANGGSATGRATVAAGGGADRWRFARRC